MTPGSRSALLPTVDLASRPANTHRGGNDHMAIPPPPPAPPAPRKKGMLEEFREFLNKGDVVTIAVGLIMALYFQQIINALLNGVIFPIIAAIFGKRDFFDIGFDLGDARINIGQVLNAIISFVI